MSPLSSFSTSYSPRRWKGKARATLDQRDDNDDGGGEKGTILPLTLVGNTAYDAVYTIPITLGTSKTKKQTFSVQVDTGSSDLWLASNTCKTDACGQAGGHLYDPSTSRSTGQSFQVGYVEGSVSGPIVWDTVQIGGYSIDNQAIGAANQVAAEPLSSLFSGILGLALPLNSEISQQVPAAVDNTPDGAAFTSNLFGLTPVSSAPGARFLSMTLERPESNKIPSLLGIGKHPTEDVPAINPTEIGYSSLVTTGSSGALFWKVTVTAITVYVDGVRKPVTIQSNTATGLGLGTGGGMSSVGTGTAVVDSGMPIILASRSITNGIYGALGVSPAADGNYYLPCTTPINMTVTLDDRPEIALHPLDLSTNPSSSATTQSCIGIIQSYPDSSQVASIADVILGVPFMRSTYTVMAFDVPDSSGNFPNASTSPLVTVNSRPRLGLLGLTDPTVALDEFNTVRVLQQPLPKGTQAKSGSGSSSTASGSTSSSGGKKLSVGVEVLIGIIGFFVLCFSLFALRWFYSRRKYQRAGTGSGSADGSVKDGKSLDGGVNGEVVGQDMIYQLARRRSKSDPYGPSEDTLRALRYSEYVRKRDLAGTSLYTDDSAKTKVGSLADEKDLGVPDEHGFYPAKKTRRLSSESDESIGVPTSPPMAVLPNRSIERSSSYSSYIPIPMPDSPISPGFNVRGSTSSLSPPHSQVITLPPPPTGDLMLGTPTPTSSHHHHHRDSSEIGPGVPLLSSDHQSHTRNDSSISRIIEDPDIDFIPQRQLSPGERVSMAGVGSMASHPDVDFIPPRQRHLGVGIGERVSMAGVGSMANRGSMMSVGSFGRPVSGMPSPLVDDSSSPPPSSQPSLPPLLPPPSTSQVDDILDLSGAESSAVPPSSSAPSSIPPSPPATTTIPEVHDRS